MALGHKLFGKGKERVFLYNDLIRVRQAKISLERATKPTREMMLEIEFLLASRVV
jgi:hypothetical protein